MNTQNYDIIDEKAAAAMIGFSRAQLQKWRWQGTGPSYFKVGRVVRYSRAELTLWLETQRRQTAS